MAAARNPHLFRCDGENQRAITAKHANFCLDIDHKHDFKFFTKRFLCFINYKYGDCAKRCFICDKFNVFVICTSGNYVQNWISNLCNKNYSFCWHFSFKESRPLRVFPEFLNYLQYYCSYLAL